MTSDTTFVYASGVAEPDPYIRITLRIPREVHARLSDAALAASHSMNAEIIGRLENSFSPKLLVDGNVLVEAITEAMRKASILKADE